MNGEELNRNYHTLCGWPEWNPPDMVVSPDGTLWSGYPPLHIDANLAITEALKVFRRHESGYRYKEGHSFWFDGYLIGQTSCVHDCSGKGETFCGAVLQALIAAKESR